MSTSDNIFVLNGLISHTLSQGRVLYCAFVDFKKAFDFVVRDILWYKLIKLGVRGKILEVIRSMYKNIKSKVKYIVYMNTLSDEFSCFLGVRQGECLSPFLFSMYLNDLEQEFINKGVEGVQVGMLNLGLLLYADDIILLANSAESLQNSLNVLADYCLRWKLTVNTTKTKIMVFRKGGRLPSNLRFQYYDSNIEIVSKFKYLGIVFTSGGSFNETDKMLSGQAFKAVFKLGSYLNKFTDFSPQHSLELFDKLITPILNYSSEVWGFNKGIQTERIHLRFCKRLLGVKQSTQNNFIYGETGRISYINKRYMNIIKYWLKICTASNNKYIKKVYDMLNIYNESHINTVNWVSQVRTLLSTHGFFEVWLNQGVGDINLFLNVFKRRVDDNFIQKWSTELNESSRALFYRQFSSYEFAKYLNIINIAKYRTAFTRLRLASHRLEVECGRWRKPVSVPFQDRKCKQCNTLEDEYHFLIECKNYIELRKAYIKPYYWKHPSNFKCIQLLTSGNKVELRKLSVYIYKAFELRMLINKYTQ